MKLVLRKDMLARFESVFLEPTSDMTGLDRKLAKFITSLLIVILVFFAFTTFTAPNPLTGGRLVLVYGTAASLAAVLVAVSLWILRTTRFRHIVEAGRMKMLEESVVNAEREIAERKRLQEDWARQTERISVLREIDRDILQAKPIQTILPFIIDRLKFFFPCRIASLILLDSDLERATVSKDGLPGTSSRFTGNEWFSIAVADAKGVFRRKIREGSRHFIAEVADLRLPESLRGALAGSRVGALLFVVLEIEKEILGLLCVGVKDSGAITGERTEIAEEFAYLIAIAIQNDRMRTRISSHAAAIEESLKQKEILFKEIHHRVKNNLQIISSMLYLQSQRVKSRADRGLLIDLENRVRSIVSIHERLYKSENVNRIKFTDYARDLARNIFKSYGVSEERVRCSIHDSEISLEAEMAVPIGLIVTELVSNSLKHAFPGERKGTVEIAMRKTNGAAPVLVVADDGVGMGAGAGMIKEKNMGLRIVEILAKQIDAGIEVSGTNGTRFDIKLGSVSGSGGTCP